MTKLFCFLVISVVSFLMVSCQDISNFRANYERRPVAKAVMSKDDSLSFLAIETINLGTISKPRFKYHDIVISNLSEVMTINIYKFNCPNGIEINSSKGMPLSLLPGQANLNSPLTLNLNSGLVNTGSYEEKIYINKSNTHFITVKAQITD